MQPGRTRTCDARTRAGRMERGEQFAVAASVSEESAAGAAIGNAYVTLCVPAGIAFADVICCARLGYHAQGDNHATAVATLRKADVEASKALDTLLRLKTKAGYSHEPMSATEVKRAGRAMDVLREAARAV